MYIDKCDFCHSDCHFHSFFEQALQAEPFWYVNCAKIPNIYRENKYLVFVNYHLARAKNGWLKNSRDEMIQVAFMSLSTVETGG